MDTPAALAPFAAELTKLKTREALVERLSSALADLPTNEAVALIADVLWLWQQDRQHLIARTAALLEQRYASRSEKASDAQIALFNTVIEVLASAEAGQAPADDPSGGENPALNAATDGPPSATQVRDLIEQTNREVEQTKRELAAQREAAKQAAREERARARANGDPDAKPWPTNLPVEFRRLEPPRRPPDLRRLSSAAVRDPPPAVVAH